MNEQIPMYLPPRDANEIIREQLESACEAFNASVDHAERVELHLEILRLRRLMKGAR